MMMRVAVNFSGFQKNPSVSESESEELGEVCISNISPAERRKRLLAGVGQVSSKKALLGTPVDRVQPE